MQKGCDTVANTYDLENLADVWMRVEAAVSGADEAECGGMQDIPSLRRFIDGEASDMAEYLRMAKLSHGTDAEPIFIRAAADERRHAKRLITEHFILTGDTYAPSTSASDERSLLTAVRNRYIDERGGAEAYENAAKDTKDPRLSALYSEFSADERRHAAAMIALIERLMA